MEEVILVDEKDHPIGTMDKMQAHLQGILHRAFSVILFSPDGKLFIQKRASTKYHSAGLWTNTCCSHPRPEESTDMAVYRRLNEELGIDVRPRFAYKFKYRAHVDENLIEHELDSVYTGIYRGTLKVNKNEVEAWKLIDLNELYGNLRKHPEHYTPWFKMILGHSEFKKHIP